MLALSPEEEARCAAMTERAAVHSAEAEGFAEQLRRLRARSLAADDALSLLVAIHLCERARCAALDCRPPSLEETLDRHSIIERAILNQSMAPLKEACN